MATSQNRRRQRADEPSRADIDPPAKVKTRSEIELEAWESWEYPPEFYDRLSKISLNRRALKELNRRTRARRSHPSPPASPSKRTLSRIITSRAVARDIARFAKHGGPDLCHLRGYPHPRIDHQHPTAGSDSRSSRSRITRSMDPASAHRTPATTKTKKSSPYNRDFDLHLTENAIHSISKSREPELEEIRTALAVPRPSLSPSKFSDGAFKAFQERDDQAKDEDDVLANVIPTILGPSQAKHYCARNTVFTNLEPLIDDTIAAPKPDIYYGAYPDQLAQPARNELAGHIVPSTMEDKPMAPNFFIEVKGPDGKPAVAKRQARYDGAVGSRAMHSLQNYGTEKPEFDGKAYTFSSTYQDGTLKLYTHHTTAPTTEGEQPEYHMTRVDSWSMTANPRTFIEGARALRNTLDLAEQHRSNFIRDANARAPQAETVARRRSKTAERQLLEDSADELASSPTHYTAQIQDEEDSADELASSPTHYTAQIQDEEDSADELASSPTHYTAQIQDEEDSADELALSPIYYIAQIQDEEDSADELASSPTRHIAYVQDRGYSPDELA